MDMGMPLRKTVFLCLVWLGWTFPVLACELPRDFQFLVARVTGLDTVEDGISAARMARIRHDLRALDRDAMLLTSSKIGGVSLAREAAGLLGLIERIVGGAALTIPRTSCKSTSCAARSRRS